ncbi:hypothetical protein LY78DRAFT_718976 [Colletotrichum sublineola]|nr:hypothetical protein LY78DRAFT_718976 [Colletotrichum sublineola]
MGPPSLEGPSASEHQYIWIDSYLGHVWAALARLRNLPEERGGHPAADDTPDRETQVTNDYAGNDSSTSLLANPQTPPNLTSKRPASSPLALPGPRLRSARVSRPTLHPNNGNSSEMEDNSSSSSSSFHSSLFSTAYIGDQGPRKDLAQLPEVLSMHLISSFVRCSLPWVPPQANPNPDMAVVLDQAPFLHKVDTLGDITFASQDDGSLRIYQNGNLDRRVALLEAKRSIGVVEGTVSIPDDLLGQLVGEALAARLQENHWVDSSDTIIIITGARHFLRFVQCQISDEYVAEMQKHASDDTGLAIGKLGIRDELCRTVKANAAEADRKLSE